MSPYVRVLRIRHWLKNLFLFAAPFFGGTLFYGETIRPALQSFIAFSLCASAVYIFNDIQDAERDRAHPKKKKRPVASGALTKNRALILMVIAGAASFTLSLTISLTFLYYILVYFFIHIAYSLSLKHIALLDIFCIASGFIIRVLAGGEAFHVTVSRWLFITMFMISLVLAAGKRLGEVLLLNEHAGTHRQSLNSHSVSTLSDILLISSAAALISYALYTVEQFQGLVYTVPIVTFGLFRYILLSKSGKGDPTEALTRDAWLASAVSAWLLLVGFIRYN